MDPALIQTLISAPPLFGLIYYLIVKDKAQREERAAEIARRDAIEKDRIETDKAIVRVLTRIEAKLGVAP
jgi:hypothetical protein